MYAIIGGLDDLWNLVIKINPRLFTIDGVNPPDALMGRTMFVHDKKAMLVLTAGSNDADESWLFISMNRISCTDFLNINFGISYADHTYDFDRNIFLTQQDTLNPQRWSYTDDIGVRYVLDLLPRYNSKGYTHEWFGYLQSSDAISETKVRCGNTSTINQFGFALFRGIRYVQDTFDIILKDLTINEKSLGSLRIQTSQEMAAIEPTTRYLGLLDWFPLTTQNNTEFTNWVAFYMPVSSIINIISSDNTTWMSLGEKQYTLKNFDWNVLNNVKISAPNNVYKVFVNNAKLDIKTKYIDAHPVEKYVKIPKGNYNIDSLMIKLQEQFKIQGITLSPTNVSSWLNPDGVLSFKFDTPINLYAISMEGGYNPMSYVLGIDRESGFVTDHISNNTPDLSTVGFLYVRSPTLCQSCCLIQGNNKTSPVFAIVPIGANDDVLWSEKYADEYSISYQMPTNLSKISIEITDQLGNEIDLRGDINMCFEIIHEL